MVHGGRIMSPESIDRLRDNAIVHVVKKVPGGGKKKDRRKATQSDQSSTDNSSSEADMVFAFMEKDAKSGRNGWNENLIDQEDDGTGRRHGGHDGEVEKQHPGANGDRSRTSS